MKKVLSGLAIIANVIGIVLPFLNPTPNNTFVYKFSSMLACLRLELIACLFCVIIPLILRFTVLKKYFTSVSKNTKLIIVVFLIISFLFSIKNIYYLTLSKYYYFNTKIFQIEQQGIAFKKGVEAYNAGDIETSKIELKKVLDINKNGPLSSRAEQISNNIESIIKLTDELYQKHIISKDGIITPKDLQILSFCAEIYPQKYKTLYEDEVSRIVLAIGEYRYFVNAVNDRDYDQCVYFVNKDGWCWFEKIIQEKFLHTNKQWVLDRMKEYVDRASVENTQNRMRRYWFY